MATQPAHDRLSNTPFWTIHGVFDPAGGGADFAYTIGLASRGSPELHMWARPSLGDDPGHDWAFSLRDCTRILNELADLLLRGGLGVGSRLTRAYDGGLATVEFRVDPAEDPEALQAHGVEPSAQVLPVRWSLRREPAGELSPLGEDALEEAHRAWAQLTVGLDRDRRAPAEWAVPRRASFGPEQRFGPLTPLVIARGAQLLQAGAEVLGALLAGAAKVDTAGSLSWPVAHAKALARRVGRSEQIGAVERAVAGLVDEVTAGAAWAAMLEHDFGDVRRAGRLEEYDRARHHLADLLRTATSACLCAQAVSDVADAHLTLHAVGPWEAARHVDGLAGLEPWRAAPHVLDLVRTVLGRRSADTLSMIGLLHDTALRWESANEETRRYGELEGRLAGWALTSAAACPPVLELLEGTPAGAALGRAAGQGRGVQQLAGLQEWATCLSSALTHRQRLTAAEVRLFAWPVHSVLPGLERVLNEPL
jgi:hypothetical protein